MASVSGEAPPRRPRRWPRRLLIGLNIFVALCVLGAAGGYLYLQWRLDQIDRESFGEGILEPDAPGEVMNVLMVGSDSREELTGADAARHSIDEQGRRVTGRRSDTIMVLHADPNKEQAAILSIPRDLWVEIPGSGRRQRVNTAFELGPAKLVETVRSLGIEINHYVEVDFIGFRNMVNAVDGVPIYVPAPARDAFSDLRIPTAGCVTLDGNQALAWVRSRHYQSFESGRWRTDPTSDFGRIQRQQDFIRRLMKRSISKGIRNPIKLNRMIGIAVDNVTLDSEMSSKDIRRLGAHFRSLSPDAVTMMTLPVEPLRVGGADVLKLKQPDAQQVINFINGAVPAGEEGPPPSILPSTVRVRTLNGSGVGGQAGTVASALQRAGFNNAGVGDAQSFGQRRTLIRFGSGQRDKALLLRSYLTAGAELQEDRTLRGVDLVLVTGTDYKGLAAPGSAAPQAAPTTPAPPPAPTTTAASRGAAPQPQC